LHGHLMQYLPYCIYSPVAAFMCRCWSPAATPLFHRDTHKDTAFVAVPYLHFLWRDSRLSGRFSSADTIPTPLKLARIHERDCRPGLGIQGGPSRPQSPPTHPLVTYLSEPYPPNIHPYSATRSYSTLRHFPPPNGLFDATVLLLEARNCAIASLLHERDALGGSFKTRPRDQHSPAG